MKKIIPFKKEILFKTKLKEVTSISLEHSYKVNDDVISGEFLVSGDYKITASSVNREDFSYKIPFEIALDSRYDTKTINLDIENFYYEIINDEILKVNIDVFVEGEYKKVEEPEKIEPEILTIPSETNSKEDRQEEPQEPITEEIVTVESPEKEKEEPPIENNPPKVIEKDLPRENIDIDITNQNINNNQNTNINTNDNNNQNKVNLFDNISMEDTYSTYYVYIVKEEDSLESILAKYKITKEELENYNDLSDIKPYDKLIIPSHNE